MLQNYIRIAWRNILKNRFYSILNITGLATGIAFTMLIAAYVWSELQVNKRVKNIDNHYIIESKWKDPNMGYEFATIGMLPKALKEQYPTLVKNYYRWDGITTNVSLGEKAFRESVQIGDSTFLSMYGFKVLSGNAATALADPFSVVISDKIALKYFGKTDVTGKVLTMENFGGSKHDFMITAVISYNGDNSVYHLLDDDANGFYLPLESASFFGRRIDFWDNPFIVGMLELQNSVTPQQLDKPIASLLKTHSTPQIAADMHPHLEPLKTFHLEKFNGVVKRMIYTLSVIVLFILLMAVVNFVNMSVSRSSSRMKEIGVRKVLGGLKKQLIWQFLTESTILVFFATLLAFVVYLLVSPVFGQVVGKELPPLNTFPLYFVAFPFLIIIVTGLVAGLYPAFILSSMQSVDSLKGKLKSARENVVLRKSLVAFQFFTAAIVLISAFIITHQVQLFFSKDLGYNKEFMVSAQVPRDWTPAGVSRMQGIRTQLASMPEVKEVTLSYEVPDGNNSQGINVYRASADSTTAITSYLLSADEHYATTYGIPMSEGKFFTDPGMKVDSNKVVINEKLAKALGWEHPADAIGQLVKMDLARTPFTIAGVTKDFHFSSMAQAIQPIFFTHIKSSNIYRFFSIKLQSKDIPGSIAALQHKWSELMPGAPFEYKFMDERLSRLYKTEIQLQKAAYTATILSIIIVLLGVTGMISLSVQKRTKEIGIRKVLGASVSGIVALFAKEFMLIILIAGLLACPVAYILMQKWLDNYAYHINITAGPFVITLLALAGVTAVLIVTQTIKTALSNPVKSLRSE